MTHPRRPRRRWPLSLRLVASAATILMVVSGVLLAAALRRPSHARLLYYQYRVACLQLPPEQVVYRFSPAARVAADPARFFALPVPAEEHAHAAGDDACELLPPHVVPVGGAGDPPALDMLNRYMQFPLADDQQILFAHALTTAAGDRRLVIAQFGPDPRPAPAGFQRLASELLVIVPATWSDPPRVLTRQRVAAADVRLGYAGTVCYAGQPDGPDAFWLTIDQQRERHRLRGVLQPDGKHVALAAVDRAPLP